jgi:hypothetical protein
MLDKQMIIALSVFVVGWTMFTFENQQAMEIHAARLAAAAGTTVVIPRDAETGEGGDIVLELGPREDGRVASGSVKQLPAQHPEQFSGVLSEVNTGCYADGECYVVVDGKHVTVLWGWTNEVVGDVHGVDDGFGSLEKMIGGKILVYANKLDDGSYTLYGAADYFVEPLPK